MNDSIMLHWIDWSIIISYIVFSLGVGIYFSKRAASSTEEYFLSGRSLPWWIVGTSMVATTFAAAKVVATMEVPTIHHGRDLPDKKYSSVLEAALFEK